MTTKKNACILIAHGNLLATSGCDAVDRVLRARLEDWRDLPRVAQHRSAHYKEQTVAQLLWSIYVLSANRIRQILLTLT
jgi:hypothetical protein